MRANFTNRNLRARRHGAGMTLIEVLVTLVIISVGLLGVAAMQLTTVRNNYDAFVRSQAAVLASDILDRIRANRDDALTGSYNVAFTAAGDTDTRAGTDIDAWKATLQSQLPNGEGSITTLAIAPPAGPGTAPPRAIITISVRWGERGEVDPLVFTTSSQI